MRTSYVFLFVTFFTFSNSLLAQQNNVGINTSNPHASAALHVVSKSNNQGILIPTLTTNQRTNISLPANGLLVYDSDKSSFFYYDGLNWVDFSQISKIVNPDFDTSIEIFNSSAGDFIDVKVDGNTTWKFIEDRFENTNIKGNVFIGSVAGKDNTSGSGNSFLGHAAGGKNTEGSSNVFLGGASGFKNTTGSSNVLIGHNSGSENTNGSENILIGRFAGQDNINGNGNIHLGTSAGKNISSGSNNLLIGNRLDLGSNVSNTLAIDNSNLFGVNSSPLIYGKFDTDLVRINGTLHILDKYNFPVTKGNQGEVLGWDNGNLAWVAFSGGISDKLEDNDMDSQILLDEALEDTIKFKTDNKVRWKMFSDRIEEANTQRNVFIGAYTGFNINTNTGVENTFIGSYAGVGTTNGFQNTCIGADAGRFNSSGKSNTFIGYKAGHMNSQGNYNAFLGEGTGSVNSSGNKNTFLGYKAGGASANTNGNVFIGYQAGQNEQGSDKLYIENSSSNSPLLYGEFNNNLLRVNGTLNINNAFSFPIVDGTANQILATDGNGNLSWTSPTGGGTSSKIEDTDMDTYVEAIDGTGVSDQIRFAVNGDSHWRMVKDRIEEENSDGNIFIGKNTGAANQVNPTISDGVSNTFVGTDAGSLNSTGNSNTFLGYHAGFSSTSGADNTFLGTNSGVNNSLGDANTFIGKDAGTANSSGHKNTIIGAFAGVQSTNSQENVFIGQGAANIMTSGNRNVFIGNGTGIGIPSGSDNILIGNTAGGYLTSATSQLLVIENSSSSTPLIWGDFLNDRLGINRQATTNALEVEGEASKTTAGSWIGNSDARLKKNVQNLNSEEMLQKLLQLQGVHYEWNDDKTGAQRPDGKQYGFIAQNIQSVFPELVKEDNLGFLQTAYGTYDAMQIEAMRALVNRIEKLESENTQLKSQLSEIETIKAEIAELKGIAKK